MQALRRVALLASARPGARGKSTTWDAARALIQDSPVAAFTKSYCPGCRDLMERFDDANVTVKEVVLDEEEDGGDALRERLREHTGQKSVPFVFIGGRFVAAQQAMEGMRGPTPALKATLEAAGVRPTGFFRT